jgi:hypothetical protein
VLSFSSLAWSAPTLPELSSPSLQRRVSLEFNEITVANLFRVLGEVGHQDFRVAPGLDERKVSLKLNDVSVRQAIESVVEQLRLDCHAEGALLVIAPR